LGNGGRIPDESGVQPERKTIALFLVYECCCAREGGSAFGGIKRKTENECVPVHFREVISERGVTERGSKRNSGKQEASERGERGRARPKSILGGENA